MNATIENELAKLEAMMKDLAEVGVRVLSPNDEAAPMTMMELLAKGIASGTFSWAISLGSVTS